MLNIMFKLSCLYCGDRASCGVIGMRILLLLSFSFLSACSSPAEKATQFYNKGMQLLEKGDLDKARLEFQNALQIKDSMTPALYGMALIAEKNGDFERLYGLLSRVVEQDPKHLEAQLKLGKVLLAAGKLDRAMKVSDTVLALDKDAPAVLAFRAGVLFKLDDKKGAVELANAALVKEPENMDALVVLATERLAAHDESKALEYLDTALKPNEKNIALQMIKVQILEKLSRMTEAEDVVHKLITFYPNVRALRHYLARFYLNQKRSEDAEGIYRAIVTENPNDIQAKLDIVRFIGITKNPDAAEKELVAFIQGTPTSNGLKFALASLRHSRNDSAGAESVLKEILEQSKDGADAIKAKAGLATLHIAAGDKANASRLINEILTADARNEQALVLKAGMEIQDHKLDQAIADLRTILRDTPNSTPALSLLAKAHETAGSPELAETHYQRAFQASKQEAKYGLPYAEFLLRRGKVSQAEDVLRDVLLVTPNYTPALALLSRAHLSHGDFVSAQSLSDEIRRIGGQERLAEQIQGVIHAGKNEYEQSISAFKRAYEASPGEAQPLAALVRSYIQAGKPADALLFLDNVLKTSPNNYAARILQGQVHLSMGKKELAAQAFQTAISHDPKNPAGYIQLSGLGIREGKYDEADAVIAKGLDSIPGDLTLRLSRAGVYELTGRYNEAISLYEDMFKERPGVDVIANNLASLLTEHSKDKAALNRAYELAQRFQHSDVPQFKDTFAWASYKVGKATVAVESLKAAIKQLPDLPVLRYHLGMSYLALNKKEEAKKELEKAIELGSDKPFAELDLAKKALESLKDKQPPA
jgi:tetratricopeptide (TPR) repeat protein